MLEEFFTWLLATFVITPVQAEFESRMSGVEVPAAIIQQVQGCIVNGAPALVTRATEEPFWGLTTGISVAVGLTDATSVLAGSSPECAAAMAAVTPLLNGTES
jgi:hypothetical protein